MIYVFYGTDREGIIKKTDNLLKSLFTKNPDLAFEKFDVDNFDLNKLRDLSQSQSLFGNKTAVVLDGILEENEGVYDSLKYLQNSENIFIIREAKILKAEQKKLAEFTEKIEEIMLKEGKKEIFNTFSFTDAIGERNKKNAWILYEKAILAGLVPEELFWKVVGQIRVMLVAKKTPSAELAGVHPFVYKKAKSFVRNYKEGELEKLSEKLVIGYHRARRGEVEIETLLEKTILTL